MSAGEDERRWLEGLDERTEYEREYEHRMSAGDRDTLAALLAGHRWDRTEAIPSFGCRCECGELVCTPDGGQSHDWHFRAHVADVIASSGWLREQRTEAWDDGYGTCLGDFDIAARREARSPNPYLED